MLGIAIEPGKAPRITRLPDNGQALERWLGGPMRLELFALRPAALAYVTRTCGPLTASQASSATRVWRGSRYYGRLLLIGWRRGRPASLPKDLAEELAREWAAEEVQ